MANRIWFQKKDIEKILDIINKFPEQEKNYQLEYANSPGLGYCIHLILEHEVNGVKGELRIPIADVDEW